jgi:hypothetical protein
MTGRLMNPVNRQYFEMARLFGQAALIGIYEPGGASGGTIFQGVATGIHSASGHLKLI